MAPLPFLQCAQRVADWLSPAHESKDVRSLSHLSLEISSLTPLCSLRLPSHKPLSFQRLTNAASMSSCAVIPLCRCVCRLWGSGQSHLTAFEFDFFFQKHIFPDDCIYVLLMTNICCWDDLRECRLCPSSLCEAFKHHACNYWTATTCNCRVIFSQKFYGMIITNENGGVGRRGMSLERNQNKYSKNSVRNIQINIFSTM